MKGKGVIITRKLFFTAFGFILALILCLNVGVLTACAVVVAGIFISATFFIFRFKYRGFVTLITLSAMAGTLFFAHYETEVYNKITALDGEEITITGYVSDYSFVGSDCVRISVKGEIEGLEQATEISFFVTDMNFDYYDNVRVTSKVKIPENSVSFNGEDYNRSQGVYLQGSGTAQCEKVGGCANEFARRIKLLRDSTVSKIYAACPNQAGAFLAATLCSEKSNVSAKTSASIYRSGLGHLFAVSGTHVVMLTAFILPILSRLIYSRKLRSLVCLAFIWSFALFAGGSPSVVRACIMTSVSLIASFFNRTSDSANSLGLAAILLTLSCPYILTSVSFVMSFCAAFSFGVISPALCRGRITNAGAQTLVSYICINTVTFPLCAIFFSEISVVSIAVNMLLIPLCTICLTLSYVFTLTGGVFTFIIKAAGIIAKLIIWLCKLFTASPFAYVGTYHREALILIGIMAISVLCICAIKKNKQRNDITACVAVFIAVCLTAEVLSNTDTDDKITIYPDSDGYCVTISSDKNLLIFDIGSEGNLSYTLAQATQRFHPKSSYIFISTEAPFTSACYNDDFSDSIKYFAPIYSDTEHSIYSLEGGEATVGSAQVKFEDGYIIAVDDHEIILTDDEITIDSITFESNGFYDVSILNL